MVAVLFDAPEAVSPKLHNQLFALFTLAKSSLEVGGLPKKRRPVLLNNWLNLALKAIA